MTGRTMGGATIEVDVSGLGLRISGLTDPLARAIAERWSAFAGPSSDPEALAVAVTEAPRAMTPGRTMVGTTRGELVPGGVRFVRDEGEIVVDEGSRTAAVELASGDDARRAWALINLSVAALSWRLAGRGGGALHAAAVLDAGRAFVLLGAEGAGKTTFAAGGADAGLTVVSDDVVLLDSGRGRLEVLGAPIRDRGFPHPGPGRWPVAALLLPRRGPRPSLDPAPRLDACAAVAANLLYVSALWEASPKVAAAADAIVAGAPVLALTFAPGSAHVPLLRAFAR